MTTEPRADVSDMEDAFSELELPGHSLRGRLRNLGPGVILMMTGIGTSHLVTAPTAGGRYGYTLLWTILLAYVVKYYGFEMAFRFTGATGRSLIEAYGTAWKKWPLWYVLVTTLLQCALGQAGRLVAAAAVLYYAFTEGLGLPFSLTAYAIGLAVVSVAVILGGRYMALEFLSKAFAGVLVLSALGVFLLRPPPLSALRNLVLIQVPDGSWLVIAALLGLLPTGIDVSLQASEWGLAKRAGMARIRNQLETVGLAPRFDPFAPRPEDLAVDARRLPARARSYVRRWFALGIWDFRQGHVVSLGVAAIFLLLAAGWLHPSDVAGQAVMGEIATIFTLSVGPWMMVVFMLGAFAATASTAFNYFDGWPRVVAACCRNLFRCTAQHAGFDSSGSRGVWCSEYNIYRATMIYSLVASVAIIAGLPRPVFLVLVASTLALLVAPVIFWLNLHYCFTIIPKNDPVFYPSTPARWFAWTSLVVFTGIMVVLLVAGIG